MFVRKSTHKLALASALVKVHQAERDSLAYHRRAEQAERILEGYRSAPTPAVEAPKKTKTEKYLARTFENLARQLDQAIQMEDHDEAAKIIGTLNAYKESFSA